jgi:nucleoside-triphosphatase THEP1
MTLSAYLVSVVTGGPGVGKTMLIKVLAAYARQQGVCCAYVCMVFAVERVFIHFSIIIR